MLDFYRTKAGRILIEVTLPELGRQLGRLADELARSNDRAERDLPTCRCGAITRPDRCTNCDDRPSSSAEQRCTCDVTQAGAERRITYRCGCPIHDPNGTRAGELEALRDALKPDDD